MRQMKKSTLFTITLLTALSILLGAVSCASGGSDETTPAQNAGTEAGEPTAEVTEAVDTDWSIDLGKMNFGGEKVNMLVIGMEPSDDEFTAAEINGGLVNDAVYTRNSLVEEDLGVEFVFTLSSKSDVNDVGNRVRNDVKTGLYEFDIVTIPGYTHTAYALEGDFVNLLRVNNLNLDKHYWTQGFNVIMSNGRRQYVASGAYSLSMIRYMYITLYNKTAMSARGLPDLYEFASAGKWTVGKQLELIKGLYDDANGDLKRDDKDFYGFVSGTYTSVDPYWVGFDMPVLAVDKSTGEFSIVLSESKLTGILDVIRNLIIDNPDTWNRGSGLGAVDGSDAVIALKIFSEENCAMTTAMIYSIEKSLTSSGFSGDYGIVPMPKYDEDQEEYRTHVQDKLSLMAIVSNSPEEKRDMLGAVMEDTAYRSRTEVFPAYYESALSYRYLQNAESKEMLDLVYNSIRIEGTFIYSASFAFLGQLRTLATLSGTSSGASQIRTGLNNLNKKLKSFNEAMAKLTD